MSRSFLPIFLVLFSASFLLPRSARSQERRSYEQAWTQVDSLALEGLPKSALSRIDAIYRQARAEDNSAMQVKAAIHRMLFQAYTEEESFSEIIGGLQADIRNAAFPVKPVLHSLLAATYWKYYQQNRYQLHQRSVTVDTTIKDFKNWDYQRLVREVTGHYEQSLKEPEKLQATDVAILAGALEGDTSSRFLRPSLYDFLAQRAVDMYIREESYLQPSPDAAYLFDDPALFSAAGAFARMRLDLRDSLLLPARGLLLLQELTRFHLRDKKAAALADLECKRLAFIYRKSNLANKDTLYVQALERLLQTHRDIAMSSEVAFELAKFYHETSRDRIGFAYINGVRRPQVNPGNNDTPANIKARRICSQAIARYPESRGAQNCRNLLERILKKELELKAEDVNIPGTPFRLLVMYRNLPRVYLRVVKLWEHQADSVSILARDSRRSDEAIATLLSRQALFQYQHTLPGTADHNQHSAEVKIDALPPGNYAVLASGNENFRETTAALSFTLLEVSAISSFHRKQGGGRELYVAGRRLGEPLENISALIYQLETENGRAPRERLLNKSPKSGKDGKIVLDLPKNRQYRVLLAAGKDTLTAMRSLWVSGAGERPVTPAQEERTLFFTDRSIYRPGQTIHFKGLMLLSGTKTKIWPRKRTKVSLKNANGEAISSLELMSNEFGTFSGSFQLPESGLPGTMSIEDSYGSTNIEVAEYKRPTFELGFDAISGIYRLNDSIKVSGKAESFAGAPIDKARVHYTVTRTGNPAGRWNRHFYPMEEPLQIAMGTTETSSDGTFRISFRAAAGDTTRVYNYQVKAHITDMNGETRSAGTSLNVGNKNLLISATIGTEVSPGTDRLYQLSARNLNGEPQQSDISLKVYALKGPEKPLRERLWEAPDQHVMDRKTYKSHFPRDIYSDEDDFRNWDRGKQCLEKEFHTDSTVTFNLRDLEKQPAGYYLAEVQAKAASGEKASEQYYFYLQRWEGSVQTPADFIKVLKNSGIPGESAEFLAGAGDQVSHLLYEVLFKGKVTETRWLHPGKQQKKIALPLDSSLAGGLAVQLTMVHQNRIYNKLVPVEVREKDPELSIEMRSFRNKLLPGEKESWTFIIRSPGNEKADAEMVAALYDASLDAILPHSWPAGSVTRRRFFPHYNLSWETREFLDESRSIMLRNFRDANPPPLRPWSYERLALFGYDYYGGYNRSYRDYLRRIRQRERSRREQMIWEADFRRQSESITEGILVSGTLRDQAGALLAGATIRIKGTDQVLSSNIEGQYKIKVPPGGVLVFSSLGYLSREIKPGKQRKLDLVLEQDPASLEEVVIAGYGGQQQADLTGTVVSLTGGDRQIRIRGTAAAPQENRQAAPTEASPTPEFPEIAPRKNFNETAFFYPQLRTNREGEIAIEFTMPESVTRWKMLGFAHTKDLQYATIEKELVTSKEVAVSANAPRFLRTGDRMIFTAKVVNLTGESHQGKVRLQLIDALSLQPADSLVSGDALVRKLEIAPFSSETVSWPVEIPEGLTALTYRVIATAGKHSDGEENTLPVLPEDILITESLPLQVNAGETRNFSINSFAGKKLPAARPYRLTLEFTANPAWYAVQALPYLMELPYECAEHLFGGYFANSLAGSLMTSSPRIKAIFDQWKNTGSDELRSALGKNQELKSALLEETPWVMQAMDESQRKKRLGLLFDLNELQYKNHSLMQRLLNMQLPDGSFPWFPGMRGNRFITQHILAGIGQLKKLNALPAGGDKRAAAIARALKFTDNEIAKDYAALDTVPDDHLSAFTVHYLYMRSFFPEVRPDTATQKAVEFYLRQAASYWTGRTVYQQGMIALILERNGQHAAAQKIIRSLRERAQRSEDKGMYWSSNLPGYFWHEAPIETQALLIEAFGELSPGDEVEQMKMWLLLNKQTTNWGSSKATAAACYALLLRGKDWLAPSAEAEISLGGKKLETLRPEVKKEAGTGYLKTSWGAGEINPAMDAVRIKNPTEVTSWGALYWQYFERPENVPASGEGLAIRKTVYKETPTAAGPVLTPLRKGESLRPGDLVKIRMDLLAGRDYEYVHLKDLRAAAFEPVDVLASYRYQDRLGYYQVTRDASTNFFINYLPKGNYVLEYRLRVTHGGNYSNGIATVQCMYAPAFSARSAGSRISVEQAGKTGRAGQ